MARKVIQIALSNTNLYALCDDGKIYRMNGGEWLLMVAVPQDGEQDKPGVSINVIKPGT